MVFVLQAHIKLEAYGFAIADATKALELDPSYVKVCSRILLSFAMCLPSEHMLICRPSAGVLETSARKRCHPQLPRSPQGFQSRRQEGAKQPGC